MSEGKTGEKQAVSAFDIKKALAEKHCKDFFQTEIKSGSTFMGTADRILDALAIKRSYANKCFIGYEIKVSRGDFKADNKMYTYLPLVHQLYLVCPKGLVRPEELPVEIGLMYYNPDDGGLTYKKKTPKRDIEINAEMLLYIIYSRLGSDRIPFFSDRAEYWREWLDNKRKNSDLGARVSGGLAREFQRLERENRETERFRNERDKYERLMKCLADNGMYLRESDPAAWLEKRLKQEYPECLDAVLANLKYAINIIEERRKGREGGATEGME